jgi:hypothetical protein
MSAVSFCSNVSFHSKKEAITQKDRWHGVAQLVDALRYKPEGRDFDFRWCHWTFSFTLFFRAHDGFGVELGSNRNEYQKYIVGVKAVVA